MTTILKTPAKINIFSTSKNPPSFTPSSSSTPMVNFTLENTPIPQKSSHSSMHLVDPWDRYYDSNSSTSSKSLSSSTFMTTSTPLTLPRRDAGKVWIRPSFRKGKDTSGDVITSFHSTKKLDFQIKFDVPKPAAPEQFTVLKPRVPSFLEWLLDKTGLLPFNTPLEQQTT